jgi:hypothetical protein
MPVSTLTLEPNRVRNEIRGGNNRLRAHVGYLQSRTRIEERPSSSRPLSFQNACVGRMFTENCHPLQPTTAEESAASVRRTFRARLAPGIARLKFDGFCREWGAQFVGQDQNRFTYHIHLPVSFYHRLLGRKPVMSVQFALMRPKCPAEPLTIIDVEVGITGCGRKLRSQLMKALGHIILVSVRSHFHTHPERRVKARIPLGGPISFYPVLPAFRPGDVLDGRCKDISTGGMRFWSSNFPSSSHVGINLPASGDGQPVSLLGRVLRVLPADDGGYEIAVVFPDDLA